MKDSDNRLIQLRQFLAEDPNDPFLHYAVCLELKKSNSAELNAAFEKMLLQFPDYLPGYYQYALLLAENGDSSKAMEILLGGIALAEKLQDWHTLAELKSLRQNILTGEYE